MEDIDQLRMMVGFYLNGLCSLDSLRMRARHMKSDGLVPDQADQIVAACDEYGVPIAHGKVADMADRHARLVNKLKAAVQ